MVAKFHSVRTYKPVYAVAMATICPQFMDCLQQIQWPLIQTVFRQWQDSNLRPFTTCVALTTELHCHVFLYFEKIFTGAIYLLPVIYGFFIGMSTRDTPPTHNIPLHTSGFWGHRIASRRLGMGNGSNRFNSSLLFFRRCPRLGGVVVVWVLHTYA